MEWLESHCEHKYKKSRNPILKFSLLTMNVKLTETERGPEQCIDHESTDAVKLKQLRDQIV